MSAAAPATTPHAIGSLVEIKSNCPQEEYGSVLQGVRLFVVAHGEDFDGSILHSLAADVNVPRRIAQIEAERVSNPVKEHDHIFRDAILRAKGEISSGWGRDDLICIRGPDQAAS